MPERTIQKINVYNQSHGRYHGRHYISISSETWKTFDLKKIGTSVICEINEMLDLKKKPVYSGSETGELKPRKWTDSKYYIQYDLVFSPVLVRKIGIRRGLFVDALLTKVQRWGGEVEEIFPNRLVYGIMEVELKGKKKSSPPTENLIEHTFKDDFFSELIIEINRAYSFRLFNSTLILVRKLLENLLIDLLRKKYGMSKLEKFYNKDRGRFHEFYKLLEILESDLITFKPYSGSFEKPMIQFLNKFRESSNSAAHSVDIKPNWDYIKSVKDDLNYYCQLFDSVIAKIK